MAPFLFEFMDQEWIPSSLHATLRDVLGFHLRVTLFYYYRWAAESALQNAKDVGATRVSELGAGSAGFSQTLAELIRGRHSGIGVEISDLRPNAPQYRSLEAAYPGIVSARMDSVDFTAKPTAESDHDVVVLSAAFHHVPPGARERVLRAMVKRRVMIFESVTRNLKSMAGCAIGFLPAMATPLYFIGRRPGRWRRFVWCWLIPVAPLMVAWDGSSRAYAAGPRKSGWKNSKNWASRRTRLPSTEGGSATSSVGLRGNRETVAVSAPTGGRGFYKEAFQRNLGLYTEAEQEKLRQARIAVAGVGGVGGLHLLALVRMGVGKFRIADLDVYDYSNLNRQFGATVATVGLSKTGVMQEMTLAVNPEAEVDVFDHGISATNIDRFLEGVDVVVDGIDFFAFDVRRMLFQQAQKRGIYVITAGPVGFGSTLQVFSPTGMSFDEYFGSYDGLTELQKFVAFATGIAPAVLHRKYMDLSRIKLSAGKAPVVASSCLLSSGFVAHEAVNVLLRKRPIRAVPHYFQFDAYLQTYKKGYLRWGAKNPMQYLKRWILTRMMHKLFPAGHPALAPDSSGKP